MVGIVEKILDDEKILVKGINIDKTIEVNVDKFKIEDFKELLKCEEPIIVIVNEETNTISKNAEI